MPVAADNETPLGDSEAATLFAPLAHYDLIALAVSGGGDSMALLHLYDRWRKSAATSGTKIPQAIVLTVDHGLRPQAAQEAEMVAARCAGIGLPHKTLRWQGPKPAAGIQQAARAARYALLAEALAEAAGEAGMNDATKALVLAHTREDQAETFLDRLARGSGVYGLAAMARESRRGETTLLRPLLDVARGRLRASLTAAGLDWVEDPSNEDPHYRRVRMRRLLPTLAREGLSAQRLADTAGSMARAAAALDGWVDGLMERDVTRHPAGPCRLDAGMLAGLPREIALRLLARLVRDTGGAVHVPRLASLEAVLANLSAGEGRRTLAGCVVERRGAAFLIHREIGRRGLGDIDLAPGETGIWDHRFVFTVSVDAPGPVRIGALGHGGLRRIGVEPPCGWPRAAFAGAPAVCGEGNVLALPGFDIMPASGWHGQVRARRIDAMA